MIGLLARLSRSIPLVIVLVLLALVLYVVITYVHSRARAKEVLIKVFTVLCSAIAILFALIALYAIVDGNIPVMELAASFSVVGVIGLLVTLFCRYRFRKNNPHYKWSAEKARIEREKEQRRNARVQGAIRAFFEALIKGSKS